MIQPHSPPLHRRDGGRGGAGRKALFCKRTLSVVPISRGPRAQGSARPENAAAKFSIGIRTNMV